VDPPYYFESELCGGAVTISISKYLPWQAIQFSQRSTPFSKTGQKLSMHVSGVKHKVLATLGHYQMSTAAPLRRLKPRHGIKSTCVTTVEGGAASPRLIVITEKSI